MNCNEFEQLLADALGGELKESDRAAFEDHLSRCDACRKEHDSLRGAVQRIESLPAARGVSVRRVGDQLILTTADAPGAGTSTLLRWSRGFMRYAASVLIAFAAGYAVHGMKPATPGINRPSTEPAAYTVQSALAFQFSRNPERSDLAKGLIAMYDAGR